MDWDSPYKGNFTYEKDECNKTKTWTYQKFDTHVSVGPYRRTKKYTFQIIEGNLVEHYVILW